MGRSLKKKKIAAALLILHAIKKKRACYASDINLKRNELGEHRRLFQELKKNPEEFTRYTRMSLETFDTLLAKIRGSFPIIRYTKYTIPAEARLAMTLKFLALGEPLQAIAWSFRCGKSTVSNIINSTCRIIWHNLSEYVPAPDINKYVEIEDGFNKLWNLPNCIGAIDGKHIEIEAPMNSGSLYFNYKQHFSIVLMAACDANYKFTHVNVGEPGSSSDGGVFANSEFGKRILQDTADTPPPKCLPGTNKILQHYFIGDQAFPLKPNIMRPFPGANLNYAKKLFNYRLSRARRTIENAFGILSARWRIFRKRIEADPENVKYFVLAAIVLHNFLMTESRTAYCPQQFADQVGNDGKIVEGEWRSPENLCLLRNASPSFPRGQRPNKCAKETRDILSDYFMSEGAVPWQNSTVTSTGPTA